MKYKIESIETKTSAKGNTYAPTTLTEVDGDQTLEVKATIFGSYPNFATLKVGDVVEGTLKSNEYNGSVTYTLEAPKLATTGQTGAFKGQQIAKAQEVTARNVSMAQENRDLGIKISSTMRMAVDITVVMIGGQPIQDESVTKATITRWRKWLWENWDKEEKDFEPFPSN